MVTKICPCCGRQVDLYEYGNRIGSHFISGEKCPAYKMQYHQAERFATILKQRKRMIK